ncbi:MAG: PA1571 family protein [Pseudomonadota bacterium]
MMQAMYAQENLMMTMSDNQFHGAALLDAEGHEIPITEEMIAQACDELMKQCHFPGRHG